MFAVTLFGKEKSLVSRSHLAYFLQCSLYQYFSLGFGPSIEHEIVTAPEVVDLLINFAYSSAAAGKMKEFPVGLNLRVPCIPSEVIQTIQAHSVVNAALSAPLVRASGKVEVPGPALLKPSTLELTLPINHKEPKFIRVRAGDWLLVQIAASREQWHCRVADTQDWPTVKLCKPITPYSTEFSSGYRLSNPASSTQETGVAEKHDSNPSSNSLAVSVFAYELEFDMLPPVAKQASICLILNTLPTVKQMQDHLSRQRAPDLSSWKERISPAALGILRWIIASNRSCIVHIDEGTAGAKKNNGEEPVAGMNGWKQFRFAMGAPDKEKRFLDQVNAVKARCKLTYPTLFAFHGSRLYK